MVECSAKQFPWQSMLDKEFTDAPVISTSIGPQSFLSILTPLATLHQLHSPNSLFPLGTIRVWVPCFTLVVLSDR